MKTKNQNVMKVEDVMTASELKYCSPDTKLHNAAKTMKTSNWEALPVVDNEKKVIGIITDRDICLSLAQKKTAPHATATVSQIMPSRIHTVKPSDDISIAFREMRTNQIGQLPVVDAKGTLKGIVSLHNLINTSAASENELGNLSASGENLFKTIHAVTNRYNGNAIKEKEKKIQPVRKPKSEKQYV